MKRLFAWLTVCMVLLGTIYGLAESSGPAAQVLEQVQALTMGDAGEPVILLQKKLAELYYFAGEADGTFGESTHLAVQAFQKDFDLEATGVADAATQGLLFAAACRPLKKGDAGEDVKRLQTRLTELKLYHGKISGNYLDGSYYAISAFQKENGLPVTGKADVKTQELLFGGGQEDATATPSLLVSTPAPTPAPTPAETQEVIGEEAIGEEVTPAPEEESVAYTKTLRKGSSGNLVELLQAKLLEMGYYAGSVSGSFDVDTREAVKAFQKNNHLAADGIAGKDTWNMLFNNSQALVAGATPRPTPVPTPVPYALTVDVRNQVITAYGLDENNEYTKVVRQMICSTGTTSTPTDVGAWKLGAGRSRFPLFTKYNCYVQYWTPVANGFGFHSVIYNTKNTMDLAVGSYTNLGRRASHGCIRMLVDDAKWIYENAGKGTLVTVTESLPYDPELTQSLKPAALNRKNMLPKATPAPTQPPVYDGSQQPPMPLRTLSKGTKGEDVYWLQMKLKELGYYNGTVTGGYYGGTQNAVKAYQKDNGLTADGVAGVKTQTKLYEDVLSTPAPSATPSPEAN